MDPRERAFFSGPRHRPPAAREETVLFHCPDCGVTQAVPNLLAKAKYEDLGSCQGCLAGRTLQQSPHLLPLFVSFWEETGFPASPSWLDRIAAGPAACC